ncbi:4-hydroxybenzoate octaprenyltransferase [Lichenihabitans sp. Uapishka_5]|uniref:4-hydroxybenzoate octaprenyltransferase n=1 Tax=Lichenihabitans sp. Uapishka_5 TaxID=3037302 RepID=UPI0029E80EEE|nr:4-hydroxybenzoate octaprenyltransferase [Lichenihabitans sp. Uapishka_5]MDX7952070.1 4-hydroxybenzoate octaprenyltransferase [Lichenihabitans sp. Uapishka_5]
MTQQTAGSLPDTTAPWLLRLWPRAWWPYAQLARIDRPIGWQLLVLPCWWGATLAADAARTLPRLDHLGLFLLGSIAMRGAGSTFNDIVDRDLDRQVERTRSRPVASRQVSVARATAFLVTQALIGALVLFSLNGFSILLGLASLLVVALYPFAKRVTHWPQAVLGLAFAYGALMGWAAFMGSLAAPPLWLYAAAIFWTIGYDTIYALQDTRDDAIVGIGSTALFFGDQVRAGVGGLYGVAAGAAMLAVWTAGLGWAAYLGWAAFAMHCGWQVLRIDPSVPGRPLGLFRSNRWAGVLLWAGLLLDAALRAV